MISLGINLILTYVFFKLLLYIFRYNRIKDQDLVLIDNIKEKAMPKPLILPSDEKVRNILYKMNTCKDASFTSYKIKQKIIKNHISICVNYK